ncbi:MAG: neutral zinc metallopeptidase [Bacteroidales bacterium]|jgi:predicted metalloprotease|nr:neutral zinc metallopeptidase [Bacteroidales bacterium]
MKWQGRQGSSNVEDRRGMSTGRMAVGGGLGTIVIVIIVLLLGGDPSQLIDTMQQGVVTTEAGTYTPSAQEEELAQFVSVVLKDTETVWNTIFEQSGSTYRQPKLVLFSGQVQSACGFATAASGPFYCPGDEKVYIDLSFCEELRTKFGANGDFAIAYVIAHEVGHHVQNLLGILDQVNRQRSRLSETEANKLTVRLELQADFLSGMWAHYADRMLNTLETGDLEEALNAAAAVGDDNLQMKYQGRIVPDDFTHGTSAQRKEWFSKGFRTGNIELGDTFSAEI